MTKKVFVWSIQYLPAGLNQQLHIKMTSAIQIKVRERL